MKVKLIFYYYAFILYSIKMRRKHREYELDNATYVKDLSLKFPFRKNKCALPFCKGTIHFLP